MASALSVNVFTAPEKAIIGERPRPWGPAMAWDATTSTLIFGENEAVLVDTLTTADEAEALARWIELHHRNLSTIYVTHMHIDHYGGLSVPQRHFPDARALATPKSVELMPKTAEELAVSQVPPWTADRDHGARAVRQGRHHARRPGAAHHRAGDDRL